uniref:BTB domain-containing protein n=1 Tax=Strongyloides papillosus TaxID=174720 RepID=A0A0N5CGP3_STREA
MAEFSRICGGDSSIRPHSSGVTGCIPVNHSNVCYQWTINNFFEILHSRKMKLELESHSFSVLGYPNVVFKMCMLLHAESPGGNSYWGLFLKASSASSKEELNINIPHMFKLTSPTRDKVFWNSSSLEGVFYSEKLTQFQCGIESRITLKTIKETLFSTGALNVICETMHKGNGERFMGQNNKNDELKTKISHYERYLNRLSTMYASQYASDFKIIFCGKKGFSKIYKVHKSIFMAHSLYFRSLLTDTNTTRSKCNSVAIGEEVGFPAVEMMIEYFYKAKIPSDASHEDIKELLHLANAYEINDLKLLCEGMLNH